MSGMAVEWKWYHSRHAELVATKKGENCVMNPAKVSFALLKSALLCLRGSRGSKRVKLELLDVDSILTRQYSLRYWEHCVIFHFRFCFVLFCFFNHKNKYYCSPSGARMFLLYSPQSSSVIKSKMAATTIRTCTSFRLWGILKAAGANFCLFYIF